MFNFNAILPEIEQIPELLKCSFSNKVRVLQKSQIKLNALPFYFYYFFPECLRQKKVLTYNVMLLGFLCKNSGNKTTYNRIEIVSCDFLKLKFYTSTKLILLQISMGIIQ